MPYLDGVRESGFDLNVLASILKPRISKLTEIQDTIKFLECCPEYDVELFVNKKSKTTEENSKLVLETVLPLLENLEAWSHDSLYNLLVELAKDMELKNGTVMWPVRIAIAGQKVTPGGAIEILQILGKDESLKRIKSAINKLNSAC